MVDFQSRDTSRGLGDDEEEEPEQEADADAGPNESGDAANDGPEGHATGDAGPTETAAAPTPDGAAAYAVVTVTNDRSLSDDSQGDAVVAAVKDSGGQVVTRDLVRPDYDGLQTTISTLAERNDVDLVVTIGGTGVEPDDVTVDALDPLLDKHLPGFGELLRLRGHETEGTAVIGTRATAGILDATPVFAVPGTVDGARFAVEELVLEEGSHLAADAAGEGP
jgi:molybdenum cofactor biosynthesis protein B